MLLSSGLEKWRKVVKISRMLFVELAFLGVTALVLMGCPSGGAAAPSTADVSKAFSAMNTAQSYAPADSQSYYGAGTYSFGPLSGPNGGSVAITYTVSDPTQSTWTATGTLTFTNWVDTSTGYTINGTVSVSETITGPQSTANAIDATITCNLTLSGGTISTLSCNIHESITFTPLSVTLSGNVTANGFQYDVTKL
jgi:hypothetical protein